MDNPIKGLFKYFQREPSHALTFGYLMLIVMGLLFDFFYYKIFKINVLLFVELDDLLLAPIQDIGIVLSVFVFCLFVYLIIEWDIRWRTNQPELYRKFSFQKDPFSPASNKQRQTSFKVLPVMYVFLAASTYAVYQAGKVKDGRVKRIHITMKDAPPDSLKTQAPFFIGKTTSYFFVYDTAQKKTTIINAGEVRSINFE